MNVPLLDLKAQHATVRDAVVRRVEEVIEDQRFILGRPVEELESRIAALSNTRFAVGVASGTDALLLALRALDLRPGDEVITSPFTFFASAGTIHNAGGKPVFADIDPLTWNVDPDAIEAAITPRTRAIMPVHLFGQLAAMERVLAIAARHGLAVIEDAAQAIGARRLIDGKWRVAGELGTAGTLSFFPTKNLGGWGDGGMLVTSDETMATRVRRLRTHGGLKMYHHEEVGYNSRLDAIQAAVLLAKLPYLEEWSSARRSHAAWYNQQFAGVPGLRVPHTDPANEHIFHQYVVESDRRDELREHLTRQGIGTGVYYPVPLHLQPCFAYLGYREGQMPNAEAAVKRVLALPVYPELTPQQREYVVRAVREFHGA
ncbi:MAG TPA: DegT/DnrJ/EryC1/StrS family aminotransferase [Gemmatimonadales bacterium]|nr:DegT/DnrJ/EryC1/StrS family aminotransferase [Gemmatimonadales bacterium]